MKEDRRSKETGNHREMEKFEKSIGVKRSVDGGVQGQFLEGRPTVDSSFHVVSKGSSQT